MARRDTARLAMASDPAGNRWFSRAWVLPPPPERNSPSAPTLGQIFESNTNLASDTAALSKIQPALLPRRYSRRAARHERPDTLAQSHRGSSSRRLVSVDGKK